MCSDAVNDHNLICVLPDVNCDENIQQMDGGYLVYYERGYRFYLMAIFSHAEDTNGKGLLPIHKVCSEMKYTLQ